MIYGDVDEPVANSMAELATMPTMTVQASFHDGRVANFDGVRIRDLVELAGVPAQVQGPELLRFLVV